MIFQNLGSNDVYITSFVPSKEHQTKERERETRKKENKDSQQNT